MIIFLYGPDTYRSRQKLNEIIIYYKKIHQSGLNLKIFDLKEKNFQEFKDEIQSVSMFAEKKLIIVKNTFLNKNFKENFLKDSKKFTQSKDIILFYEEGEVLKDEFFNFLKKYGKSQEFKLLEGEKLKNWIKKEFEGYQVKTEPGVVERLINFVGNDLWQLNNEIKKLISYKKNKKIEIKDVDLLVRPKIETDIFQTIDWLALKNKKKALESLHRHLEKGESPFYLLSMINFQFRNLLMAKSGNLRGMHSFLAKKTLWQSKKFTLQELKKIYQKIFEVDLSIKTGKIDPETALDLFIAEI
ncbi:MAG: DNA polymerase III subunit delta [Patescibacteria group bacterium]|nr:DNA polymerase III subunit delta [Patescibacteria group bacterium]